MTVHTDISESVLLLIRFEMLRHVTRSCGLTPLLCHPPQDKTPLTVRSNISSGCLWCYEHTHTHTQPTGVGKQSCVSVFLFIKTSLIRVCVCVWFPADGPMPPTTSALSPPLCTSAMLESSCVRVNHRSIGLLINNWSNWAESRGGGATSHCNNTQQLNVLLNTAVFTWAAF